MSTMLGVHLGKGVQRSERDWTCLVKNSHSAFLKSQDFFTLTAVRDWNVIRLWSLQTAAFDTSQFDKLAAVLGAAIVTSTIVPDVARWPT